MIEKIIVMDQMLALASMYSNKEYDAFIFFGDVQLPFAVIEYDIDNRFEGTSRDEDFGEEICGEDWDRNRDTTSECRGLPMV